LLPVTRSRMCAASLEEAEAGRAIEPGSSKAAVATASSQSEADIADR
jgi:hypothetical protein